MDNPSTNLFNILCYSVRLPHCQLKQKDLFLIRLLFRTRLITEWSFLTSIKKMSFSLPCSIPECLKKYLEFFNNNHINVCISGGYCVYRAGFTHTFKDVDIFVSNVNFNERSFLDLDDSIEVIPDFLEVLYPGSFVPFIDKRFALRVNGYKIDFVLMNCDVKFENNFLFSEHVTSEFDVDICRVSIILFDTECCLIFNSNFKVFIRDETWLCESFIDESFSIKSRIRFLKYEGRLKDCYRIFSSNSAPPFDFDRLMSFHQLNMWIDGMLEF